MPEIYEFSKNQREKVKVALTEFNGNELMDIRIYFESENGEWLLTKKRD